MNTIKNITNFIAINKKFFLFIVLPIVILIIAIVVYLRLPKTPIYDGLNNPIVEQQLKDQKQRIEVLEYALLKFNQELREKIIADSILYSKGQKQIAELNISIQNNKIENEKKHIINNNTDFNESSIILKSNIKKRGKKY